MHNIEHYDYQENVNRKEVQADLSRYVSHQTWQEGGCGIEPIRWNDHICTSYEEAEQWIKEHDRGWYDQLAVKYYSPLKTKTAKTEELDEKIQETYKVYNSRNSICYPKTRTSEFIGCGKCKSRLASQYLSGNYCPVCRADLRPDSTLKSIAAARNKWENAQKMKKEYLDKHSKKEIRWLVKIEYHT